MTWARGSPVHTSWTTGGAFDINLICYERTDLSQPARLIAGEPPRRGVWHSRAGVVDTEAHHDSAGSETLVRLRLCRCHARRRAPQVLRQGRNPARPSTGISL